MIYSVKHDEVASLTLTEDYLHKSAIEVDLSFREYSTSCAECGYLRDLDLRILDTLLSLAFYQTVKSITFIVKSTNSNSAPLQAHDIPLIKQGIAKSMPQVAPRCSIGVVLWESSS